VKGKKVTGVEDIFVDGLLANDSCSGYSIAMFGSLSPLQLGAALFS